VVSGSSKRSVGRYSIHREIASGGMATVYLGRLNAAGGVGRIVAIKRLHAQFAKNPDFVTMFLDEARLATRIHHPNVVPTLDVLADEGELFVVMDYVRGESLARLNRSAKADGKRIPVPIVASVLSGVLQGLQAAHEAVDEQGKPLGIVHRDVSPQNVLVGEDGMARILDFGVAKAASRLHETQDGQLKGKLAYMAPEQIDGEVTELCDVYAAGIVLWEALTGQYLFRANTEGKTIDRLVKRNVDPPSQHNEAVGAALDVVAVKALQPKPEDRYGSAGEMAQALDEAVRAASILEVGKWVKATAGKTLQSRQEAEQVIESGADSLSGFPNLPADLGSGELTPPSAASESRTKHSTAITVRSGAIDLERKRRRWPLLAVAGAVAAAAIWFVATGRLTALRQPSAPAAEGDTGSATTAPVEPSAAPSTAAPPVTATASATTEASAEPPVASASAAPSTSPPVVVRPPTVPRPAVSKPPPAVVGKGDPNDIDSLIETRK